MLNLWKNTMDLNAKTDMSSKLAEYCLTGSNRQWHDHICPRRHKRKMGWNLLNSPEFREVQESQTPHESQGQGSISSRFSSSSKVSFHFSSSSVVIFSAPSLSSPVEGPRAPAKWRMRSVREELMIAAGANPSQKYQTGCDVVGNERLTHAWNHHKMACMKDFQL